MARRVSLGEWIRDAMLDPDKDAPLTAFSLVHMVGQQQLEIHGTKILPGSAANAEQLANIFQGKAEAYSQDLIGVQHFVLLAFYGGREQPQARHPFLLNGKTDLDGATEAPDERGRVQQSMRHTEMFIQQVFRRQQTLDEYSNRMINSQAAHIQMLQTENRDMFQILRESMMREVQQNHAMEMERLSFERATTERKKILQFLPPLVNTILGKEVFPQSTADTALIETIVDSLSGEDVQKLMASGAIKPEILGPLFARFEQVEKKRQAEAEERKALMPPAANPEREAAGETS